jgi:hypothetical protein
VSTDGAASQRRRASELLRILFRPEIRPVVDELLDRLPVAPTPGARAALQSAHATSARTVISFSPGIRKRSSIRRPISSASRVCRQTPPAERFIA